MGLYRIALMVKNIENWNAYLWYKFTGKKSESFTFKMRNKFSVCVPKQILPEFKENVFDEVYLKNLPSEVKDLKSATLVDIGANVGYFTIFALLKFKDSRIISFEPMKRNFAVLQKNMTGFCDKQVTLVNKAVHDTKGELVLKFDCKKEITTSASLFDNQYGNDEEVVTTTTLEHIFSEYSLAKIDILKLDCEGAEYGILYKTHRHLFDKINCITMETHPGKDKNENTPALANYLKELGFTIQSKPHFIWAYKNPQQWV